MDGRSQRGLYKNLKLLPPTVSTEGLLLSIMIDACEERDVAAADIAGAYLKALMRDFVLLMKFTGDTVRILCEMNPKYKKFVTMEGGVRALYVRLNKAI